MLLPDLVSTGPSSPCSRFLVIISSFLLLNCRSMHPLTTATLITRGHCRGPSAFLEHCSGRVKCAFPARLVLSSSRMAPEPHQGFPGSTSQQDTPPAPLQPPHVWWH